MLARSEECGEDKNNLSGSSEIAMRLLPSNSSRGTPPFAYLHSSRVCPPAVKKKKGEKEKETQFTSRRQTEFSAAEITAFIGAAVNLACKLPDTREFAGATFELNGDLRAVGVPRHFSLAFFFLPTSPSSRATHDRSDF